MKGSLAKALIAAAVIAFGTDASAAGPDSLIPSPVGYSTGKAFSAYPAVRIRERSGKKVSEEFRAMTDTLASFAAEEAYRLSIGRKVVTIEYASQTGRFRALQTLRQLELAGGGIPCCTIWDYPRYRHRGLMIDESRSFKGKDFIKKQLDAMAILKMNSLHLHLTDAAGWRIQIKSRPELTDKAAWRIGRTYAEWERGGYPFASAGNDKAYGGFYTTEDLREIVAYAAERHIQVIPEIEMPGHSMEVNRTYPEIACRDSSGRSRHFSWDLCPGNEGTFELLEDVLSEVIDIFPCKYIHIGGDEAVMKDWPLCVNCRRRMQEEGFSEVRQLQGYLVRRMAQWLSEHGRSVIGWDEIAEVGLPADAVVMSWRGRTAGDKAASEGRSVIMSPTTHCYFDYYQDLIRKEPLAVGELTSLHWVLTFEPGDDSHILGLQANLWCEKIPTPEHAEYMLYPRLYAISEIGWAPKRQREPEQFRAKARSLLEVFRRLGYNTFDMDSESDFARAGMRRKSTGELIYPAF